jgi:hypothetical protein
MEIILFERCDWIASVLQNTYKQNKKIRAFLAGMFYYQLCKSAIVL